VVAGTGQVPAANIAEIAPDHATVQMPGTGHFLMLEQPAAFNAILAEFLETRAAF
jgi:pimeloyl-ACP methyl ester carboxylesterase